MKNIYGTKVVTVDDKEFNISFNFSDYDVENPIDISYFLSGNYHDNITPGSEDWENLLNYIRKQSSDGYIVVTGNISMSCYPGKAHLLELEVLKNSLIVTALDDIAYPNFTIKYIPDKSGRTEYSLLGWFGASAEERLIILEPGPNDDYDVYNDNVILPPWLDSSLYGNRLDTLSDICYDNAYNRTYINVTLKLYDPDKNFGYDNFSKVYQGQLYVGYNDDTKEYEAHITTCDGDYVIKYENVEDL